MQQEIQESKVVQFPVRGPVVKADTDEGYTRIANTLLESIYQADLSAKQIRVFLAIVRKTYGFCQKLDWISSTQIAELINYSGDSTNIRSDIRVLKERNFLVSEGKKIGPNPIVSEWELTKRIKNNPDRKQSGGGLKTIRGRIENNPENGLKTIHTKEKRNLSKETNTKERGEAPASPKRVVVPYQEILNLYHEILPMCPQVKKLTKARSQQIKARWDSDDISNLEDWEGYFQLVAKSKFLTGRVDPMPGRKLFKADLEWLTKESNFVKVWEGRYHGEQ